MAKSKALLRSVPEDQGIPSPALMSFLDGIEEQQLELHSLMLVRNDHVVAEGWWFPYTAQHPHMLFSLSKSFTSTAIGFAVDEGLITVNDPVISFFPDDLPEEISPNLAAMRIKQLLSMSTGHDQDTTWRMMGNPDGDWVKGFLSLPVEHKPGTHFVYNTGATYMLSAILHKVTGQGLIDYLTPRLFEPLGIKDPTWETCPKGIATGGFGLSITTEDIARFGMMLLHKGEFQGRRIISEAWVEEATSRQASNGSNPESDWEQGYGYQYWRCRHGAYRGDGAFGQYCIVMPAQNAVLAITSGLGDMQAVMNLAWDHLLSAMQPHPLPRSPEMSETLATRLDCLRLDPPQADPSPLAKEVSGKTYFFGENDAKLKSLTFTFAIDKVVIASRDRRGKHEVEVGNGRWLKGRTALIHMDDRYRSMPVMAGGGWTAPDTYTAQLRYHYTPFMYTITARFAGDEVTVVVKPNVSFGSTDRPALVGKQKG